jgi:hypothetical protein
MKSRRARKAGGVLLLGVGALCGACNSGSPHVIGPGATTTTTISTTASSAPSTSPSTTPGGTINPSEVAEIDSELKALNTSLSQAQSDLTNPNKGDE